MKLYIYENYKLGHWTMEAWGVDEIDCEVTDEEYTFIQCHEAQAEKYQMLLKKIHKRNKANR